VDASQKMFEYPALRLIATRAPPVEHPAQGDTLAYAAPASAAVIRPPDVFRARLARRSSPRCAPDHPDARIMAAEKSAWGPQALRISAPVLVLYGNVDRNKVPSPATGKVEHRWMEASGTSSPRCTALTRTWRIGGRACLSGRSATRHARGNVANGSPWRVHACNDCPRFRHRAATGHQGSDRCARAFLARLSKTPSFGNREGLCLGIRVPLTSAKIALPLQRYQSAYYRTFGRVRSIAVKLDGTLWQPSV